jgi:hypothetical protein
MVSDPEKSSNTADTEQFPRSEKAEGDRRQPVAAIEDWP